MTREAVKADRLESVLSGDTSPDDVSRELARLATLAERVHESVEIPPLSEAVRARLRDQLLTAPGPRVTARPAPAAGLRRPTFLERLRASTRMATATAVASTLVGTTGVAAAAQHALPGDLLYPVKSVTEDARLVFASDGAERGRLHLSFARERLEEVETGVDRLGPEPLRSTFSALDHEAATGANLLLESMPTAQARDELTAFTAEVRTRLLDVESALPLSVRASADRTLEVLRRIDVQVTGPSDQVACESCGATGRVDASAAAQPRVVLPGDGPAVTPCNCVEGSAPSSPGATPSGDATGSGAPDPTQVPGPIDDTSDADDGSLLDDTLDLREGTGQVGSLVDELLREGIDDARTPVEDTVDDVETTVEDTVDDVESTVDDTASEVDDAVDDLLGDDDS